MRDAGFDPATRLHPRPQFLRDASGRPWLRWLLTDTHQERYTAYHDARLVGLHTTSEQGALGILADGFLRPGPMSFGEYVVCLGHLADTRRSAAHEGWKSDWNRDEAARLLAQMHGYYKHTAGLAIEIWAVGQHRVAHSAGESYDVQEGEFVHVRSDPLRRWHVHTSDSWVRALVVDVEFV
jgi:hypothetical protein